MSKVRKFKLNAPNDFFIPEIGLTYVCQEKGVCKFKLVEPSSPLIAIIPLGGPERRFFELLHHQDPEEKGQSAVSSHFRVVLHKGSEEQISGTFDLKKGFVWGYNRETISRICEQVRLLPKQASHQTT